MQVCQAPAVPGLCRENIVMDPVAFPALIAARAAEDPDLVFVVAAATGRTWTYGEILLRARQWAAALAAHGVSAGDTVATMLVNEPESVAIWLGIAYLGAIEVPGNLEYRGTLLRHFLATARAQVAVVDVSCAGTVAAVAAEFRDLALVVVGAHASPPPGSVPATSMPELLTAPDHLSMPDVPLSGTGSVMFTSGTTGPSKGVIIPWMQLHESAIGWMPTGGAGAGGRSHSDEYLALDPCYYSPFPFHHMASRAPLHLMALLRGRVVMRPSFKTDLFWPEVRKYGCTSTELLGTMALFLKNLPPAAQDRDNPMRSVLVVPLIPQIGEFADRFGVRVWTVYNMTELSIPLVSPGFDLVNATSCGRIRPGYDVRIVDTDDMPVAPGTVGELVVRADRPWAQMAGYWDMPAATIEAWRNLWFHTGDGFRQDQDGNFYFVDRMKDTIRRRGENISSIELEIEVQAMDEIVGAAAIGVPSGVGEEDVKIVAVRRPDAEVSEASLVSFLAERVPRFMLPRYVEWVADLPRTPTQKIRKAELRKAWRTPRTWDAAVGSYVAEGSPASTAAAGETSHDDGA
jgi:crotonobetaine/carnitine-CoA ligase